MPASYSASRRNALGLGWSGGWPLVLLAAVLATACTPAPRPVRIESSPEGAKIELDPPPVSTADDGTFELLPARYTVRLSLDGYKARTDELLVAKADSRLEIDYLLREATPERGEDGGVLKERESTKPTDDGKPAEKEIAKVTRPPEPVSQDGGTMKAREKNSEPEKKTTPPPPPPKRITVMVTPNDAVVTLDGKLQPPARGGQHELEIPSQGRRPIELTVRKDPDFAPETITINPADPPDRQEVRLKRYLRFVPTPSTIAIDGQSRKLDAAGRIELDPDPDRVILLTGSADGVGDLKLEMPADKIAAMGTIHFPPYLKTDPQDARVDVVRGESRRAGGQLMLEFDPKSPVERQSWRLRASAGGYATIDDEFSFDQLRRQDFTLHLPYLLSVRPNPTQAKVDGESVSIERGKGVPLARGKGQRRWRVELSRPGMPDFARTVSEEEVRGRSEPLWIGPTTVDNSIGIPLTYVPPGKFVMGAREDERTARPDERPSFEVTLTSGFLLGVHEVTQGEYFAVTGKNPSFLVGPEDGGFAPGDPQLGPVPVDQVTWDEAVEFCRLLSERPEEKRAGRVYRLPTEAEWEYACRAGSESPFAFGQKLENGDGADAVVDADFPGFVTIEAQRRANAFGLRDMHGNMLEWVADAYAPYSDRPVTDPLVKADLDSPRIRRVLRGGCFKFPAEQCRAASRFSGPPDFREIYVGFRVACDLVPLEQAEQRNGRVRQGVGPVEEASRQSPKTPANKLSSSF